KAARNDPTLVTWPLLAMAHYRCRQVEQAQQCLATARRMHERALPDDPLRGVNQPPSDWLEFNVLLHEAVALINSSAESAAFISDDLGNRLSSEGKFADAEAAYRESVRLDPKQYRAHVKLANSLVKHAQTENQSSLLDEAAGEFVQALDLSEDGLV